MEPQTVTATLDPGIVAAAIVTVVSALATAIIAIINVITSARDRREARLDRKALSVVTKSTDEKTDRLIEKTEVIRTETNSNLSQVSASLAISQAKNEGLEKMVAQLIKDKGTADRLATATVGALGTITPGLEPKSQSVEESPKKDR